MKVEFLIAAEQEFADAVFYYNQQRQGLGFEFASEIKRTLQRITAYPEAWPLLSKRTRRCRTKQFPYNLIYQIRDDVILIIGVMHERRSPVNWKTRIENL